MYDGEGSGAELAPSGVLTSECICTTPWKAHAFDEERLTFMAKWFHARRAARNNRSILQLMTEEHVDTVLVADAQPKLYHRSNPTQPVFFHPGMAQQRLAALQRGEPERLVARAQVRTGDTIVDATLGLGTDSLVLAQAVGEQGRVIAIEASFVLARLFLFEKYYPGPNYPWLQPLLNRIEVMMGDHTQVLSKMPSASVDVVVFDPMFRKPVPRESNLSAAREFTLPARLAEAAWREAQRVARRTVVLKERPDSGEFQRFSLQPDKPRARFAYGVWNKSSASDPI